MILRILFLAAATLEVGLLPIASLAAPPQSPHFLPGFPSIAGEKVLLFWSPIPGAVSYKILVDGKLLAVTADAWHTAPLPDSGEDVRFQVSAVSGTGEESEPGAPRILRLRKIEAPKDMQGATSPDPPSVVLAWKAVRGAVGYNVYRSVAGGDSSRLASVSAPYLRDRSVSTGSRYGYAVAAIDRSGREGEQSAWITLGIPGGPKPPPAGKIPGAKSVGSARGAAEKAKVAKRPSSLDVPFGEVRSIETINGHPLREVTYLGTGHDNAIWVVLPGAREIHAIQPSGEAAVNLGPAQFDAAGPGFTPNKMDVGMDGRLVVSDARSGTVACFDRRGNLLWSSKVQPPSSREEWVWDGFPPDARDLPPRPSSVLVLPGEVWVADPRLQLIYRLGPDGAPRGHITHYRKGADTWRLRRVGELEVVSGKGVLVTFPLARKAMLVDWDFRVLSEIVGSRKDPSPGFLGLHGIQSVRKEGVLLTDPVMGRIQLYDSDTGEHLLDLRTPVLYRPNMAALDAGGRLWVYLAGESRIAVLEREGGGK